MYPSDVIWWRDGGSAQHDRLQQRLGQVQEPERERRGVRHDRVAAWVVRDRAHLGATHGQEGPHQGVLAACQT